MPVIVLATLKVPSIIELPVIVVFLRDVTPLTLKLLEIFALVINVLEIVVVPLMLKLLLISTFVKLLIPETVILSLNSELPDVIFKATVLDGPLRRS